MGEKRLTLTQKHAHAPIVEGYSRELYICMYEDLSRNGTNGANEVCRAGRARCLRPATAASTKCFAFYRKSTLLRLRDCDRGEFCGPVSVLGIRKPETAEVEPSALNLNLTLTLTLGSAARLVATSSIATIAYPFYSFGCTMHSFLLR